MISSPRVGKRPVVFITLSAVCSGILFYLISTYQLAWLGGANIAIECDLPGWADQWISHVVYAGEPFSDPAIDVVYAYGTDLFVDL